jgi:hypothetical protein
MSVVPSALKSPKPATWKFSPTVPRFDADVMALLRIF